MFAIGNAAGNVVRARSARHARDSWAKLVETRGEVAAFTDLAAEAGGSDAAYRKLTEHGIATDLA